MMRRATLTLVAILVAIGIAFLPTVMAYVPTGYIWPAPTTAFNVEIPGRNNLWNEAFEAAAAFWNTATVFEFRINRNTLEDPCLAGNGLNGVGFAATICGDSFGASTLAVTRIYGFAGITTETNIVFNDRNSWDVYDGPYEEGVWSGIHDFRRVAVHELGHALGLRHENDVPSIMNAYAGGGYCPTNV